MDKKKSYTININEFCQELDLKKIYSTHDSFKLDASGINRPGLQLAGYYEYFDSRRIQIVGKGEISYLRHLPPEKRKRRIDKLFNYDFPCLIVTWGEEQADIFLEAAEKYDRNLFSVDSHTSDFMYELMEYIGIVTAPNTSKHGVFVEVHGVGVLIMGDSGIGKSETAIELIQRGSTLIADDSVTISRYGEMVVGSAPEQLRYYMELRGIGIIDIAALFGAKSVKQSGEIDLVIKLVDWKEQEPFDRLGLDENTIDILGVDIPLVEVPVSSGRNLAIIIETAAINSRMKQLGINTAEIFCESLSQYNTEYSSKEERSSLDLSTRIKEATQAQREEEILEADKIRDQREENS